jgi:hypothetical protein
MSLKSTTLFAGLALLGVLLHNNVRAQAICIDATTNIGHQTGTPLWSDNVNAGDILITNRAAQPDFGRNFDGSQNHEILCSANLTHDGDPCNITAGEDIGGSCPGGTVMIGADEDVDFRATGHVELKPGFHTSAGCFFHAYVAPNWQNVVFEDDFSDAGSIDQSSSSRLWNLERSTHDDGQGIMCLTAGAASVGSVPGDDGSSLQIQISKTTNADYKWADNIAQLVVSREYTSASAFTSASHYCTSTGDGCDYALGKVFLNSTAPSTPFSGEPYGKYEFRAQQPFVAGLWPNNWMYNGLDEIDLSEVAIGAWVPTTPPYFLLGNLHVAEESGPYTCTLTTGSEPVWPGLYASTICSQAVTDISCIGADFVAHPPSGHLILNGVEYNGASVNSSTSLRIHGTAISGGSGVLTSYTLANTNAGYGEVYPAAVDVSQWHAYSVEWLPHEIRYLVDGVVRFRWPARAIPTSDEHYDVVSKMHGKWLDLLPGSTGVLSSYKDNPALDGGLPAIHAVDYVRVWSLPADVPAAKNAARRSSNPTISNVLITMLANVHDEAIYVSITSSTTSASSLKVSMYDMLGRLVRPLYDGPATTLKIVAPINSLAQGAYFISAYENGMMAATSKVLVIR